MQTNNLYDPKNAYRFDKEKNAYHIDIHLNRYTDLFNAWDQSPLRKRDIDKDLGAYLEACSHEISLKYKIILNFFLPLAVKDLESENKNIASMQYYFSYTLYMLYKKKKQYNKRAFYYSAFGLPLITAGYLLERTLEPGLFSEVLALGIFIGGWVLFWEAFSLLFFKRAAMVQLIKEYTRFLEAEINYQYDLQPLSKTDT
jgi:hypothetical protein